MDDSTVSGRAPTVPERAPWLLLIHQVAPKPDYLRVKVRRRLERLGALPIKNSVYVLPHRDDTVEDFEWLAREIVADGGEATLCAASFLSDARDAELRRSFRAAATVDTPVGRTWVTRSGVFVDRIASAWLIRRFIDPQARFAFVSDVRYQPRAGEVRFDMFEAEYTHEGDRCTFETLLSRFALHDAALRTLGEIVHDIDLKDEKYARAEAPGVSAVLAGICAMTRDDAVRVDEGSALFDGLYATLGGAFSQAR